VCGGVFFFLVWFFFFFKLLKDLAESFLSRWVLNLMRVLVFSNRCFSCLEACSHRKKILLLGIGTGGMLDYFFNFAVMI